MADWFEKTALADLGDGDLVIGLRGADHGPPTRVAREKDVLCIVHLDPFEPARNRVHSRRLVDDHLRHRPAVYKREIVEDEPPEVGAVRD